MEDKKQKKFYLKKEFLITKIFLIFLLIICSCSEVPKEKHFKGFLYNVIDGRSITITKYTGHNGSVHIPASIGGLPVTTIGDNTFYNCDSLTSVTIPSSVTNIGNFVFSNCDKLKDINVKKLNNWYMSIEGVLFDKSGQTLVCYPVGKRGAYTIPSFVTTIGFRAFYGCDGLTSVFIPSTVITIGSGAFSHCGGLKSVFIPSSVTTIGYDAFSDCGGLTSVFIPSSVTTIEDEVFYGCKRLTSVTIPSSVTSIKYNAFSLCINLTDINVETLNSAYMSIDGILFDKGGQKLIYYPKGKTGAYTIPSSVTTIEKFAFSDCDGLTSVTIPSSVTTIGNGAFSGCKNMTDINVETLNNTYMSVYGVLFEKGGQKLICYPAGKNGAYAIYSSIYSPVTDIGDMAFYFCEGLTHITIPSTITTIGDRAFSGCKSLTSVIIPSSVTTIGENAFDNGLTLYQ